MKEFKKAFFYLKDFVWQSVFVSIFNITSCIFEGVSIGMFIPVLQSMMPQSVSGYASLSFLNKFQYLYSHWNQK